MYGLQGDLPIILDTVSPEYSSTEARGITPGSEKVKKSFAATTLVPRNLIIVCSMPSFPTRAFPAHRLLVNGCSD